MNKPILSKSVIFSALAAIVLVGLVALATGAKKDAPKPAEAPKAVVTAPAAKAEAAKAASTQAPEAPKPVEPTAAEKAQYLSAYGWMVGQQAGFDMGFSADEVASIMKGIQNAAEGQKAPENMKEIFPKMQEFLGAKEDAYRQVAEAKMVAEAKVHKAEGAKYLSDIAKQAGVVKSASGLYYKIITAGNSTKPTDEDTVTINYTGKLSDGSVFDSSTEHGAVDLPLMGVIPGFKEGVELLGEGGKALLYVPAELAYGDRAAGPIPAGSTLSFEVELVKVQPKTTEAPAPLPESMGETVSEHPTH